MRSVLMMVAMILGFSQLAMAEYMLPTVVGARYFQGKGSSSACSDFLDEAPQCGSFSKYSCSCTRDRHRTYAFIVSQKVPARITEAELQKVRADFMQTDLGLFLYYGGQR